MKKIIKTQKNLFVRLETWIKFKKLAVENGIPLGDQLEILVNKEYERRGKSENREF